MQDTKLVLLTVMPQDEVSSPSNVQSEHYGGLVGRLSDSTITNSYATGDVSSPSNVQSEHYGGLLAIPRSQQLLTATRLESRYIIQSVMVGLLALPLTQQLLHVTRLEILSLLGILGMYYIILVGLLAFRIARRQLLIVTRLGLHQALQVLIIMAGLLALMIRPSLAKASITTRILMG